MQIVPIQVKTSLGIPRISVTCKLCNARWVEESHYQNAGKGHSCPKMVQAVEILRVNNRMHQTDLLRYQVLGVKAIEWSKIPNLTKCTHRCRSATGHKCDCECGGLHHGTAVKYG